MRSTTPAGTLDGRLRNEGVNLDLVGSLPLMLGAAGLMGVMRRRPRHEG